MPLTPTPHAPPNPSGARAETISKVKRTKTMAEGNEVEGGVDQWKEEGSAGAGWDGRCETAAGAEEYTKPTMNTTSTIMRLFSQPPARDSYTHAKHVHMNTACMHEQTVRDATKNHARGIWEGWERHLWETVRWRKLQLNEVRQCHSASKAGHRFLTDFHLPRLQDVLQSKRRPHSLASHPAASNTIKLTSTLGLDSESC